MREASILDNLNPIICKPMQGYMYEDNKEQELEKRLSVKSFFDQEVDLQRF